ncbi:MAG: folate-binding protein YgfZ [Burkholderiales bacterium]
MDTQVTHFATPLPSLGVLSCTGDDARGFLHAQLTSDIAQLSACQARLAGWCSAKGRLLATMLVVPREGEFLLQLPRSLGPGVAKRLSMFILRAKVKLADASDAWRQHGVWGPGAREQLAAAGLPVPHGELAIVQAKDCVVVEVAAQRYLVISSPDADARLAALSGETREETWLLEEIRAGRPQVLPATQEQFVPQMVNLERLGGVDFHKGCYPGQEVVARTQYRGVLKRRMVRARVDAPASAGEELFADEAPGQASGNVVNAASAPEGHTELLAVVQISALESGQPVRLRAADGPALELLALPYA